ncbi:MAG: DUF3224 domain-containing protein [Pseudomonadota bacterium]
MKRYSLIGVLLCFLTAGAQAQTPGGKQMSHATGSFEVKVTPDTSGERAGRAPVGRMLLDKQYSGPLEATGQGDMLSAGTPGAGAAVYVAVEHVTGTLNGKRGGFLLAHLGTMNGASSELNVSIVPGSGTGELAGISGKCGIRIVERKHFYDLEYTLP